MPPRRAIDVRQAADGAAQPMWRMSLLENAFNSFLQSGAVGDDRRRGGEGRVRRGLTVQPLPIRQVLRPGRRLPALGVRDGGAARAALRRGARTTVDWAETDSEYYLRADIPGARKCDVEVSGDAIGWSTSAGCGGRRRRTAGLALRPVVGARLRRRVELPDDADWRKLEAYFDDGEGSLEIRRAQETSTPAKRRPPPPPPPENPIEPPLPRDWTEGETDTLPCYSSSNIMA
ncbi:hypothetical protein GUJ93_ZPchr0010g9333 [Zizania palustris]|uniref:SHSP domain-containing protein n=1 Tax=Zizania palustris TaxID=103762 RepID=A0A8J6BNN8_ZIZPA|nr:hypothetical protein GUJ93_ZPchr0010g9333 [Zizania palustris]